MGKKKRQATYQEKDPVSQMGKKLYIPNEYIHHDLKMSIVEEQVKRFAGKKKKLDNHKYVEVIFVLDNKELVRRL